MTPAVGIAPDAIDAAIRIHAVHNAFDAAIEVRRAKPPVFSLLKNLNQLGVCQAVGIMYTIDNISGITYSNRHIARRKITTRRAGRRNHIH